MALSNEQWNAPPAGGGDFYSHQIANSCRFSGSANDDGTHFMYHARGTPTNGDICTISAWVKRSKLGGKIQMFTGSGVNGGSYSWYGFNAADEFLSNYDGDQPRLESNAYFRDPSAWYHIVIANDSTQGTAANRNKVYINGVQYTDWGDFEDYSTQNADLQVNVSGARLFVGSGGASEANSFYPFDGYIAEYVFIDGTQYAASNFGETKNGAWIPKDPSGLTFGDNGAYLKFENSAALGNDSSGNDNDFTLSNVAAHDQMTDTPTFDDTNGGNFATMNPLGAGTAYPILAEGNLMMDAFSGSDISGAVATYGLPPQSGKWYFECFINAPNSGDNYPFIGLTADTFSINADKGVSQRDLSINLGTGGSEKSTTYVGTITTDFTDVAAYADNTVCGVFVDMDARKLWYAKDGAFTNSGNPQDGTNPNYAWTNNITLIPHFISFSGLGADSILNFGQEGTFAGNKTAGGNADVTGYGNFLYDPGDYKALCTGNFPIIDEINPAQTSSDFPQKLFNTVLHTGSGAEKAIAVGFQPDWSWIKERGAAGDHKLTDSSRGVTKSVESNTDIAEATETQGVKAFTSTGITLGTDAAYNNNTDTYVSWNWRVNGGSLTTNDVGNQTSYTQTDPSGAFSIVKYAATGNAMTIGHGLSVKPILSLIKDRDAAVNWMIYTQLLDGSQDYLFLNTNAAAADSGLTGPNTSIWSWQSGSSFSNTSGRNYIMYNFANVEGYCKVAKYEGNGNANGAFVYTGFSPAWIMIKSLDSTSDWQMFDNKRLGYNVDNNEIQSNESDAEATTDMIDILSNGFKCRIATDPNVAETYIYLAFAHNPFKYATAR